MPCSVPFEISNDHIHKTSQITTPEPFRRCYLLFPYTGILFPLPTAQVRCHQRLFLSLRSPSSELTEGATETLTTNTCTALPKGTACPYSHTPVLQFLIHLAKSASPPYNADKIIMSGCPLLEIFPSQWVDDLRLPFCTLKATAHAHWDR